LRSWIPMEGEASNAATGTGYSMFFEEESGLDLEIVSKAPSTT
jgi:hypothetical protein